MKKVLSIILAAAMMISLVACGGGGTEEKNKDTSVLEVALTNSFTGASPINTANPYRMATFDQVYETLFEKDGDDYVGILAESWENKGGGTWDVVLFEGITDSEGNSFTSNDVAFVLDGLKEAGHVAANYYEAGCVSVTDDTHFSIQLNTDAEGAFYYVGCTAMMCTEAAYNSSEDHMATMAIGTGPYKCTSYREGSSCTLEKREDYWKTENIPAPSVANYEKIEISYVTEVTQMSIAVSSNTVQFAGQIDMSIADEVDAADGMETSYVSNGTFNGLEFNMYGREVSENKALREAICYAIDVQGLIDGVYGGHAEEMMTYGVDTATDFNENWTKKVQYDAEKAKEKLKEAGFNDGTTITMLANNVGEDSKLAELIQGYLAAVDIECELDYVDPATQLSKIAEGNWDIVLLGGASVVDMSIFWGYLYSKEANGMSRYFHNDPALYEIYDAYVATGGKTEENLQKLYEYESENLTWYPLFEKEVLFATSDGYGDIFLKESYMAMPYLGTLEAAE